MTTDFQISTHNTVPFRNRAFYCIGSGRMGLALTREYQEELAYVQRRLHFSHVRAHGLFCDDLAICRRVDGALRFNFTYLDRVMDFYRSLNLRHFLELGFMPEALASGTQTVFTWKGNVTPPREQAEWARLVQATLRHLMNRYGADEVVQWPVEVWNEPNLSIFWRGADKEAYFTLFRTTFQAVKEVDSRFQVCGPAVCGGDDEVWVRDFLQYCRDQGLAVDAITRHHYTIERPVKRGEYAYSDLIAAEDGFANLRSTREITDSFPAYRGLPIHLTEFNTSYTSRGVIHDTPLNAALLAQQLSRLGDVNESYSYWTFGDLFEEEGVPVTLFHGGFGLVSQGCIPKPAFWTFDFFRRLWPDALCRHRDPEGIVLERNGAFQGILWNLGPEARQCTLSVPAQAGEQYVTLERLVDEAHGNPLKLWHDLGEPPYPTDDLLRLLREAAVPRISSRRVSPPDGEQRLDFQLQPGAVLYFEFRPCPLTPDAGYRYEDAVLGRAIKEDAI